MILKIAKFEAGRYLRSPASWIILALVQFLFAQIFYSLLSAYLSEPGMFEGRGLTDVVIAGYYRSAGLIYLLILPFLTMRLISEEIRTGTINLLMSSPIYTHHILIGKYMAVMSFILIQLIIISLLPLSLAIGTSLDYGHFLACILGLVLQVFGVSSIGLFFSSLFRSQSIAAIATFALLLLLTTSHLAIDSEENTIFYVFNYLSMSNHFTIFTEGVLSTTSVIYFIVMTLLFLTMATWKVNTLRAAV